MTTIKILLNYFKLFFLWALPWRYHYYYTKPSSLCDKLQATNGMNILVFFINLTYSSPLVFSICFTLTGIVKKYITHQRKKGPKNANNSIGSPLYPIKANPNQTHNSKKRLGCLDFAQTPLAIILSVLFLSSLN